MSTIGGKSGIQYGVGFGNPLLAPLPTSATLGANATAIVQARSLAAGSSIKTIVQLEINPDPLDGVPFTTVLDDADGLRDYNAGASTPLNLGSSVLEINGLAVQFTGNSSVNVGDMITMTIAQRDVTHAIPMDGTYQVSVLTFNGTAWAVAASFQITTDTQAPTLSVTGERLTNGDVLITARTPDEDASTLTVTSSSPPIVATWAGLRDARTGQKIYLINIPSTNLETFTFELEDLAGNTRTASLTVPTVTLGIENDDPDRRSTNTQQRWNLPPWLEHKNDVIHLLDAGAAGLFTVEDTITELSGATASADWLPFHARIANLEVHPDETPAQLRARITAIPARRYADARSLEEHLTYLAGARITVTDQGRAANAQDITLDGSRILDGTWDLGGVASTTPIGQFLVTIHEPPQISTGYLKAELDRLRIGAKLAVMEQLAVISSSIYTSATPSLEVA